MSVWSSPSEGSFWIIASIEMSRSARMRVMSASTPGRSSHAHAQVVAGLDLAHRQERHVGELVGLEREVRHAVLGVGGVHARDVDQVGDHRARRRLGAGAGAVVQRRADRVALDQHGVHHALDVGDQPLRAGISVGCTRSSMPAGVRRVMPSSLIR